MMDSFKLWVEAAIERDLAEKIVFDAANVSGDEALVQSVKPHRASLYKILTRGIVKPYKSDIESFLKNATDETTLNDLINHIVRVSSEVEEPGEDLESRDDVNQTSQI